MISAVLKRLYKVGLINYKPVYYFEIYDKLKTLEASGLKHSEAVRYLAGEMKVNRATIYRAYKQINDFLNDGDRSDLTAFKLEGW